MKTASQNPPSRTPLRLALAGLLIAVGPAASLHAATGLSIDVGFQPLLADTAGQTVDLFIQNTADTPFQFQGLTLRVQVDDGLGGGNAPSLTGVDAVTGTPWQGHVLSVNNQTTQSEFWDVRLLSNFFAGDSAQLGAHTTTKLATLTFDTTGLGGGDWDLKLAGFDLVPDPGDTKYNLFGTGDELFPEINNGQLSVLIPVPEPSSLSLLALAGVALVARYRLARR